MRWIFPFLFLSGYCRIQFFVWLHCSLALFQTVDIVHVLWPYNIYCKSCGIMSWILIGMGGWIPFPPPSHDPSFYSMINHEIFQFIHSLSSGCLELFGLGEKNKEFVNESSYLIGCVRFVVPQIVCLDSIQFLKREVILIVSLFP